MCSTCSLAHVLDMLPCTCAQEGLWALLKTRSLCCRPDISLAHAPFLSMPRLPRTTYMHVFLSYPCSYPSMPLCPPILYVFTLHVRTPCACTLESSTPCAHALAIGFAPTTGPCVCTLRHSTFLPLPLYGLCRHCFAMASFYEEGLSSRMECDVECALQSYERLGVYEPRRAPVLHVWIWAHAAAQLAWVDTSSCVCLRVAYL